MRESAIPRNRRAAGRSEARPRRKRAGPARERRCGSRCCETTASPYRRTGSLLCRLGPGHEQDEEIRRDDGAREEMEGGGEAEAVGDQPAEERPDRGAERLRTEEDPDARSAHVPGRRLDE